MLRAVSGPSSTPVLALLLALLSLSSTWQLGLSAPGIDYFQYWVVAGALEHRSGEGLYAPEAGVELARSARKEAVGAGSPRQFEAARRRPVIEIFSSPLLFSLFTFQRSGDYERDLRVFQLLALVAGALGIVLLARVAGFSGTEAALALALFALVFEPLQQDAVVGNVNRFLLLLVALHAWLGRPDAALARQAAAGAVLGLAAIAKPLVAAPLLLAAWWLACQGRWREVAAQGTGAVLAAGAGVVLAGARFGGLASWLEWSGAVRRLQRDFPLPVSDGNLSPVQLLSETLDVSLALAPALGLAALTAGVLWLARHRPASRERATILLVSGLGCVLPLLSSRLSWSHYFVLTVPLLLWHLRPVRPGTGFGGRRLWVGMAAALLLSLHPYRIFPGLDPRWGAACASLGAALLLASALFEYGGAPAEAPRGREGDASRASSEGAGV